jgi:ABC-type nitrate/sulfonate/bicarbonate transport system substrate-binding protein
MTRIPIVLALLLSFSCASPEKPATLTKVRLNMNPSMTYAPLMIAKDEGYFAAEGIDAEFVTLDTNSAVAATIAGKIDVLSQGLRSSVFNMILQGQPLRVVAGKGHSDPSGCTAEAFIAPIATARAIEAHGGSLEGQRFGIIRGGSIEYLTTRFLEARKTNPDRVVILQMPQGTFASARDKFDGVRLTTEPNLSSALSEGWAAIVARSDDVAPRTQNAMLVYGKRLLQTEPEVGHRFMRAYLRGARTYNEGKTARNVEIISRYTKLSPDIVRRSCWTAIEPDGRIDPKSVQPFLDWAVKKHYLNAPIAVSQWWDPTFVDAAAR